MSFTSIPRTFIWESAAKQMKEQIASSQYPPGSKLPSERELCEQFGISRISLREALRALSQEGFVDIQSGRGTFVLSREERQLKILRNWISNDTHNAIETFELRQIFEPGVAALVACDPAEALIEKLSKTIDTMESPETDALEVIAADEEFHRLLGMNTKNDLISGLVQFVMAATGQERSITLQNTEGIAKAVDGHKRILSAIQDRDPVAAEVAMRDHLTDAVSFATSEQK